MSIVASSGELVPAPRKRGAFPAVPAWQTALRDAVRSPAELARILELPPETPWIQCDFPLLVPREFVRRMRPGDAADPLLVQVLPRPEEAARLPGFVSDPVGDREAEMIPGLLHKYHGRVLLIVTGACAVHCRYCFRREYPYEAIAELGPRWDRAIAVIATASDVREIILSGGDPLMVSDARLGELANRLAEIPHLRRLRIHSRLPIVLPQRVCDELLYWLTGTRLTPIMVVHANHPREIDDEVSAALGRLVDAGVPVLNQAVLLRGVNDSAAALGELCEKLSDLRVMPYYVHQLDRVNGAAHFEVPIEEGRAIISELRRRLPGYALPRYVQEIAGRESKTRIDWD